MSYLKLISIKPNQYSYVDIPKLNCTVEFSTNNLLNREIHEIDIPVYYIDFEKYKFITSNLGNNNYVESEIVESLMNVTINSSGNTAIWSNAKTGLTVDFLYYLTKKVN